MAYVREAINAHVREYFYGRLQSTFIQRNPWLYFLGLRSAEGRAKLGTPKAGAIFGGMDLGKAQVETKLGSKAIFHTYQKSEPDDGAHVDYGGATPTASAFAEDNAGQTEFRWTTIKEPVKIRKHFLRFAKGDAEIGSAVEDSLAPVWNRFLKRINNLMLYGGTTTSGFDTTVDMNSAAEQGRVVWREPLGIDYAVGNSGNLYGRVDRAVETSLDPVSIDASTAFQTTVVDLDINRMVNNGYVDATSSTAVDGIANKSPNGYGVNLFVTTPALFNTLAEQADARGINVRQGVEGHSVTGFKASVIEHDGAYYTWAKEVTAGEMYGICLDEWMVEIAPGKNFTFSGFTDKENTEEGGGAYEWGNYEVELRVSCTRPDINCHVTGLTTG